MQRRAALPRVLAAGLATAALFIAIVLGTRSGSTGPSPVPELEPEPKAAVDEPDAAALLEAEVLGPTDEVAAPGEERPGLRLSNGEVAPELPGDAPKAVRFGVALFEYRGAQGATPTARPKDEALALAESVLDLARSDFAAAIAKADPGSLESAGSLPRGVLEPAPEHVLFTLAPGEVGGPVDTPRGYWIVKRLE